MPSLFSSFKKGKKLADQKKAEVDATKTASTEKPTEEYRHVISHASRDAITGAPSGWLAQDRQNIKQINKSRSSMISRESSYVSNSGFPRVQSYASEASGSQYQRTYNPQMPGTVVRSTSYLNDKSTSRRSTPPARLDTRHHSYNGRHGFAANGAYVGAAQPFTPSPLATTSNSPTEENGPEAEGKKRTDSEGTKSTSSSSNSEVGGVEMPAPRQKQVTPPQVEHPIHRNSKRKYRESAPPPPTQNSYQQYKTEYVVATQEVAAEAVAADVTEIHAPVPQRQYSAQLEPQAPTGFPLPEPTRYAHPASNDFAHPVPAQVPRQASFQRPMRPQSIPAPVPAHTYAFDHAPMAPANSNLIPAAAASPVPVKKPRWSFQRLKRNSAVVAH